jgi:hypothetical protein
MNNFRWAIELAVLLVFGAVVAGAATDPESAGRWYAKAERAYHQERVR